MSMIFAILGDLLSAIWAGDNIHLKVATILIGIFLVFSLLYLSVVIAGPLGLILATLVFVTYLIIWMTEEI